MLSDKQRRRLEQEKNSFEQSYELQTEKIARLRNAFVIETNPLSKFQYEQQIKDEETELRRLNDRLDEIEKQLQFAQSIPIISELKSIQKTNVSLSSQQRKELQLALIDAFPNTASLEQMLSFELDKNLRAIAGEGGLQDIVFKLIQTSIAQGWVEDLVRGACDYNPGNQQLKVIAQELLTKQQPEIISISSSNIPLSTKTKDDAIAKYRKKVEEFIADDGEISFVESEILKDLQETLELTEEQVRAVRDELLKPLGIYKKNLDKYRQVFTKLVDEKRYPLNEKDKVELKKLQEYYHLKEEDIALLFKEAEQQQIENFPQQEVQRLQRQRESEELIRIKHKYNLRELKDKLSELTSSLPTINITVLGTTGVGKTCYLFGLYSMMEAGDFTLISQDTDDHLNLIEGYNRLTEEGEDRFPVATYDSTNFCFYFSYKSNPIAEIKWLDYRGGALRDKSTQTDVQQLIASLNSSSCVFLYLSGEHFVKKIESPSEALILARKARADRMNLFLIRLLQKATPVPVVIVITKFDLCMHRNKSDIVEDIQKIFTPLFTADAGWLVAIIPVSLGKALTGDHYTGSIEPINFELPLAFAVYAELLKKSAQMEKYENQVREERNKLLQGNIFGWVDKDKIKEADNQLSNIQASKNKLKERIALLANIIHRVLVYFNGKEQAISD